MLVCEISYSIICMLIVTICVAWKPSVTNEVLKCFWQSSFLWGYLISPIAGGTLVDFYGGKVVMAGGVALWSLATFLTPWAADKSLWALLAARATLGIAEGVALPSMNNMVAR